MIMKIAKIASRSSTLALTLAALVACKTVAPTSRPPEAPATRPAQELVFARDVAPGVHTPTYALTASDGTGLRLAVLEVRAVVQGPLALTQLRLGFDNPEQRILEGRFTVTLPEGAAVSRFAMKIAGAWQEGEVVERLTATKIYESYMHRRVDPALLEHDAGGRFQARVFPILGGERKELILTYSQELADPHASYRVPLLGLPQLTTLDVRVLLSGADERVLTLERNNYTPEGDLLLAGDLPRISTGVRSGSLVAARVELAADPGATPPPTTTAAWTILLDTSASQAVGFPERVHRLRSLIAALAARAGRDIPVEILGFDQEQVRLYKGPGSGFGDPQIAGVIARGALGATDPASALRWARRAASAGARVVIVSDGIATLGDTHAGALTSAATEARAAGVARIDAVLAGSPADRATLRAATTTRAAAASGVVVDAAQPVDVLVDRLLAPVLHDVAVEVPGSRAVWPRRLDGVQPGDAVVVYAELDEHTPLQVRFKAPLRAQSPGTTAIQRPLLERSWRAAELRELVAQHAQLTTAPERDVLRARIVDLSLAHRVLTPFTALLVLETEADYKQFKLDRRALSDILVIGDAGLEVLQRDLTAVLTRARDATKNLTTPPTPLTPGDVASNLDSDADGIPDAADRCPFQPEDRDGMEDEDGCPDVLAFDNCQIKLTDKIYFKFGDSDIDPRSHKLLDDVRDTLNAAPDLDLWVDGHTDSRGDNRSNTALSQRRVDAVKKHLVEKGRIDPDRLEPRGMGEEVPIADNKHADGRAANRRVEFSLKQCTKIGNDWASSRRRGVPALADQFLAIDQSLTREPAEALRLARAWWSEQPGDLLAALALGRSLAAVGQPSAAARAYASLIDLSPSRAEHRRHAGTRLEAIGALDLAVDTYRHAVQLRPDHPHGHRLLAFALARLGRHAEAFTALEAGLLQKYPPNRFRDVQHILGADLAILGAAWIRGEPAVRPEVERRLAAHKLAVATTPSLHFVLTWEADAADVDLLLLDANGRPAHTHTVVNTTDGYGPDLALFYGISARDHAPYTVHVFYRSRRAMGHALGAVHVLEHDGAGRLGSATLPFVLMQEHAGLDLGVITGSLIPADK